MIPKIIHYCWFGRGEKSDLILKCIDSWKKYCPDYEIIEWNEDNFDVDFCDYSHDAYQAKISYFYRSCHADMFCTFFCPFGRYSNKQIPKTFAKSGILLSVEHFLCYDIYIWRQSCAAGNGGHSAAK